MHNPLNPDDKITSDMVRVVPSKYEGESPLVQTLGAMLSEFEHREWDSPALLFGAVPLAMGYGVMQIAPPIYFHPADAMQLYLDMKGPLPEEVEAVILVWEVWNYSKAIQAKYNEYMNQKADEAGMDRQSFAAHALREGTYGVSDFVGFPPSGDPHRVECRMFIAIGRDGDAAQMMAERGVNEMPDVQYIPAPSTDALAGRVPDGLRSLFA